MKIIRLSKEYKKPEYRKAIYNHFKSRIKNPDKGSEFEKRTNNLRHIPTKDLIPILLDKGYDAVLGLKNGKVIAHFAYQKKPGVSGQTEIHAFSAYVDPKNRGDNLGSQLGIAVLDHAKEEGIEWVQLGTSFGGLKKLMRRAKDAGLEKSMRVKLLDKEGRVQILKKRPL